MMSHHRFITSNKELKTRKMSTSTYISVTGTTYSERNHLWEKCILNIYLTCTLIFFYFGPSASMEGTGFMTYTATSDWDIWSCRPFLYEVYGYHIHVLKGNNSSEFNMCMYEHDLWRTTKTPVVQYAACTVWCGNIVCTYTIDLSVKWETFCIQLFNFWN